MISGSHKISLEEYLKDPCVIPSLTRSIIKNLIFETPAHAFHQHPRLNPNYQKEEKEIYDIGTVAHSLFLEGLDKAQVLDVDDWRTKAARSARDELRAKGRIPLLKKQWAEIETMVKIAQKSLLESELKISIDDGDSELSYIWNEGETWFRVRPDWISKDRKIMLDYKTTGQSAEPENYTRIAVSTGLDIQDALYRQGVVAIEDIEPEMVFMVQEVDEPYLCSFIELDMMFQDMGKEKVKKGTAAWRECMSKGHWPGYSNRIYTVEAPPWSLAQWEMRKNQ